MSAVDRLYCLCEDVVEGNCDHVPRYFANIVIKYGKEVFDKNVREEIIEECESNMKRLVKAFRDTRDDASKCIGEADRLMFWSITLPNLIGNPKMFQSVIGNAYKGAKPFLKKEDSEMMLESYGSKQFKDYVDEMSLKSEAEIVKILEVCDQHFKEMRQINNEIGGCGVAVELLKNFDSVAETFDFLDYDPASAERFKERIMLSRNGVKLKVE